MNEQEIDEVLDFTIEAISEIRKLQPKKNGKWRDAKGSIKCPKCDGILHYTISSYNGHIWGTCETNECIRWMM